MILAKRPRSDNEIEKIRKWNQPQNAFRLFRAVGRKWAGEVTADMLTVI